MDTLEAMRLKAEWFTRNAQNLTPEQIGWLAVSVAMAEVANQLYIFVERDLQATIGHVESAVTVSNDAILMGNIDITKLG